ncbi:hypothetical protein EBZ35_08945, partial [bacterium]|nr:hypothetical protein [bacterium]
LYPRWCMSANAGLGAPLFVLYFPLPFYAASVFYPLTLMPWGVTVEHVYLMSTALATFITACTCYWWLRDIVSPKIALLACAAFLLMPYRSEMLMYRAGYAESWCFAFLPLIFKYTRDMALGKRCVVPLTSSIALAMLSHIPTTASAVLGAGVYLLFMSGRALRPKLRFATAAGWASLLTAFYMLPATFYARYMIIQSKITHEKGGGRVWTNDYLSFDTVIVYGQWLLVTVIISTIAALIVLAIVCKRRRMRAPEPYIQKEIYMWGMLFVLAFFLLVQISAPLYGLLGGLNSVLFPWRMQALFVFSGTYLLAVWMEYLASDKQRKTGKADYCMLMALLFLVCFLVGSQRNAKETPLQKQLSAANFIIMPEYCTLWTSRPFYNVYYTVTQQR